MHIAEETTVTETFDNQEINTDITFVYVVMTQS